MAKNMQLHIAWTEVNIILYKGNMCTQLPGHSFPIFFHFHATKHNNYVPMGIQ